MFTAKAHLHDCPQCDFKTPCSNENCITETSEILCSGCWKDVVSRPPVRTDGRPCLHTND